MEDSMAEVTAETVEYWRGQIRAWEQSGQKGKPWCRENNIRPSTFYSWRARLHRESEKSDIGGFREIAADTTEGEHAGIEIQVGQIVIRVYDDFNESTLRRLLPLFGRCS